MKTKLVRTLRTALAAAATIMVAAGMSHADEVASLDPTALDAAWRAAPIAVVDGTFMFKLPAKAGADLAWHKLPFALKDGGVIELCGLRGTLDARALLDDLWVGLGPIGPETPAGPCVLVSGQKVLVANTAEQPTTGRATPK